MDEKLLGKVLFELQEIHERLDHMETKFDYINGTTSKKPYEEMIKCLEDYYLLEDN